MNRRIFDLELLRTFVMVVDCGGFTPASLRLHSTQSTVSQKVLRLEELAGQRLLERSYRNVQPTDAGATLLGYARRMLSLNDEMFEVLAGAASLTIRLGVPDDFAAGRTTHVIGAFNRRYPLVKLEVTSGLGRDLSDGYDQGALDLVLLKQRRGSREVVASWPETLCWIDSARVPSFGLDPVPLVTFSPRGLYRDDIIGAVEQLGRRWRISFSSSSLGGIQAAVADGMGISLLPARAVTEEHLLLPKDSGLAAVDSMEIAIIHRATADPMIQELGRDLAQMLEQECGGRA